MPYGILADSRGRRFVSLLGLTGILLSESWFYLVMTYYTIFPFWAVYLFSLFLFIGGSSLVLTAALTAIVADVTTATER